ncbi:MAG: hypothetical protein IPJ19_03665 [Planctomycetes bacterium]|nr:hypothetical protein [Planctomycetota bacterium]
MAGTRIDRFHPLITVQNESTLVADASLRRTLRALQKQILRDFAPAWGLTAKLVLGPPRERAMRVVLRDRSDEKGDLGYHFHEGYPVTYVFVQDDIEQYGEYTSTLSHELLEMIADPGANLYADGFVRIAHGGQRKAMIPYEVCDAVEENLYEIEGVRVADFLLPEWFEPEHPGRSLTMDFLGVLRRPFELAPGGYTDAIIGKRYLTFWSKRKPKTQRHRMQVRRDLSGCA